MEIETGTWNDALEYAAASDLGMRRGNNQDSFVASLAASEGQWQRRGHLFVVADGMGAHAAGELASQMAVDSLPLSYNKLTQLSPPLALRQSVVESNHLIHAKGEGSVGFHGMGTTCSTLLLLPQTAIVAQVGDSRVYRLRGDDFEQLTFDHSLVWELAEAGQITEEDVPQFVPKNVITRSLGPHETVDVDLEGPHPLMEGDTFLLCSDGLTGPVTDVEIGTVLANLSPTNAVQTLIDIANLRGGPDNITAVVVRVQKPAGKPFEMESAFDDTINYPTRSVHPAVLGAMAVLLVVVLVFSALGNWTGAIVSGVGLMLAALFAVIQRATHEELPPSVVGPLGRGPYRKYNCTSNKTVVAALAEMADELREVPKTRGWEIDMGPFEDDCQRATAASSNGEFLTAVREYCAAIRRMMKLIRQQKMSESGDSNIL